MDIQQIVSSILPEYGALGNATHCRGEPYKQVRRAAKKFSMCSDKSAYSFFCVLLFSQLFDRFSYLEYMYLGVEKSYDANPGLRVMQGLQMGTPVFIVILSVGETYMKRRPAFNMSGSLACWNGWLAFFSFYGAVRTVPHLLYRLSIVSWEESVCESPCTAFGSGAAGLATQLFVLSKIPELFDTAFLVLRKKPVLFLHWYHHITVLLYCWHSYITESSTGLYFVAMNYTVHTAMYSYYCMQALRMLPTWFPAYIITIMQILQMLVGAVIVLTSAYFYTFGGDKYAPGKCNEHPYNVLAGGLMYGSYLYLFIRFAVKRFLKLKTH